MFNARDRLLVIIVVSVALAGCGRYAIERQSLTPTSTSSPAWTPVVIPSPVIPKGGVEPGACSSCQLADQIQKGVVVRMVYFHAEDDPVCQAVTRDVIEPLRRSYGQLVDVKSIEVNSEAGRLWLTRVAEHFRITAQQRALPMLVIGEQALIGERMIRERLTGIVEVGLNRDGIDWPAIPGIAAWSTSN